jgi:hypothetical protein
MNITATVFALICAFAAGINSCILSIQSLFQIQREWMAAMSFVFCLLVLFGGPVAAADGAIWSYGVGGGLVCAFIAFLCYHHQKRIGESKKRAERLGELCPNGKWDATNTFHQALSVCLNPSLVTL